MEGPDTETAPEAVSQDPVVGSTALRPLFLGNLNNDYAPEDVTATFEAPFQPERADGEPPFEPIPVDRIDVKRGYCFVFLKDAKNEADKERIEAYLKAIQGV
jgi:arginine/serine-rich splicing factor 4/5/6